VFELLFTHPVWAYRTGTFSFAAGWPLWVALVLLAAGIVLIALGLRRRRELGSARLLGVGILQTTMLALVLALLWRPVLTVERVRDRQNVVAVAIDASASMAEAEGERSRLQEAATALQGGTLDALREVFDVRLFAFSRRAQALTDLEDVPAPGPQTRIGDALLQMLQTAGSVPLAGIVLISDGAENGDTLTERMLAEIAGFGVPVHTVGVGPEEQGNDVELERLSVAAEAAPGAAVLASVGVRHGPVSGTTRLRVYDRERLLAAQEVTLPGKAGLTEIDVVFPAGQPGTRDLRFTLDPLPGEANVVNNTRTHLLAVPARRRAILYVEGEPRWEYKFLRRAVAGERSLRLASMVRTTPNKTYRQGIESPAELAEGFPRSAEQLFRYDAVIIGSYEASTLNAAQHRLLHEFVDRRGGSVLMLGARRGLAAGGWHNTRLAQALPTHLPARGGELIQATVRPRLTLYGRESAITRLDGDPARNEALWQELPALANVQSAGRLKPGAVVLLEAAGEGNTWPLLAWQRYGRGATYVLGTASTMRWQMHLPPEDQRHETFWRQLLRAMTDTVSERITLRTERAVYDDETRIVLEAELRNERYEPITDAQVEVLVAPEHGGSYVLPMNASGDADGRYTAIVDAQAPGLYRFDMSARAGVRTDGADAGRQDRPGEGAGGRADEPMIGTATAHARRNDGIVEYFATRQNRPLLERVAEMTGGRYWRLTDLDRLVEAIPYTKAGIVQRQTLDLWNLPIVFLVLLALKLAEWALRLKWGRL